MSAESELGAARNWFRMLRLSIEEISDPTFQQRVWMGDLPEPISSYLEVSTTILEDVPFDLIHGHLSELGITREQWADVKQFCSALRSFDALVPDPYDIGAVVGQPRWSSIVDRARALLAELPCAEST